VNLDHSLPEPIDPTMADEQVFNVLLEKMLENSSFEYEVMLKQSNNVDNDECLSCIILSDT
jgi:hypothetical protein